MLREHERTLNKLRCDLGPVYPALCDESIIEVMCNADGTLWVDTFCGMRRYGEMASDIARNLINTVASTMDSEVTSESPNIGGEIRIDVKGEIKLLRFQGVVPPIVQAPVFSIRKPASKVMKLSDYIQRGALTLQQAAVIVETISSKGSILIVGSTSSGKTTFCNAILDEIATLFPQERVVLIEDTVELQCNVINKIQLRTSDNRNMDDLLKYCLRLRPDRIVVGEVRGPEAYSLIKAWNTGHSGVGTVHSNSARSGLLRIEQLMYEAGVSPCPESIMEAIKLIVYIEKTNGVDGGRKVKEVLSVKGCEKEHKGYIYGSE